MDRSVLLAISDRLKLPLHSWRSVSGGDISDAYLLEGDKESVFCKIGRTDRALEMFRAEGEGLRALARTGVIKTPEVLLCEQVGATTTLVLEYIPSKKPSGSEMEHFGEQLAALHQIPQETFGWPSDNFIGSLPQSNTQGHSWARFYIQERLLPQLELGKKRGLLQQADLPLPSLMEKVLNSLLAGLQPSLLHGDLWGGNYLIASDGSPYLIDPAIYRGHGEIDLAMSQLFGGFPPAFYKGYENVIPPQQGHLERKGLYQLYYLLVHLNLFGASYLPPVRQWIKHYFGG